MRHETYAEASTSASSQSMGYLQRATFAQALMERSWMKEKEAKKLFQDITGSVEGIATASEAAVGLIEVESDVGRARHAFWSDGMEVHRHFCPRERA